MNQSSALALVSKYRSAIWDEWRRIREKTASTDLVAVLRVEEDDADEASVLIMTRAQLLKHLHNEIPDTIKTPAGSASPAVPNVSALWVFVLRKGETGLCLRMTESKLVKGGEA